jgi:hypothetical protein
MKATIKKTDYRLTLSPLSGNRLPKKSPSIAVTVNGEAQTAAVTTNAAWSADATKILAYVWIVIDGRAYYITGDYAQPASDFADAKITTSEGTAARVDPVRVTAKVDREATRVSLFKATWAARS